MSRVHLPGPAALRGHRERGSAAFIVAASFVPERNLRAHANGEYAPSGAALVAYKVHLRIPPHAWFTAEELAAYGIAPDGSKPQKVELIKFEDRDRVISVGCEANLNSTQKVTPTEEVTS